jgi:two-component sensor histidine kinase/putative methionine-R-sulfoxide reductase with GAF domain
MTDSNNNNNGFLANRRKNMKNLPGYNRRYFVLKKSSLSKTTPPITPDALEYNRLRRALIARTNELAIARAHIREIEEYHDERNAEVEALRKVGEAVGALFDIEEMLKVVTGIAVQVTSTDSCQVYLMSETRDELILRAVDSASTAQDLVGKVRLKVGEGLAGWVAQHKKATAITHHAYQDSRFKLIPELEEHKYQSMLSAPLIYRNEILGVINVRTLKDHTYTQTQVRLLQSIASQIAGAVENTRQYRRMEKRASQLSTLSEVSKTITSDMYLEEILQLIVAATAKTMNFKITTLMLADEDRGELVIKATQSKSKDYVRKPNIKIGDSIAGKAILERKTITVTDVRRAPGYRFPDIAKKEGLCSMAAVPLEVKGKIIGVLNCYTEKPHNFTDEEITFLTALGNHAAIAIEHAKLMVKSAIIQEMHHRVKNNLQQVASLLRLQMRYVGQRSIEQVLNESLNRILAIASVHELLSREDLDIISVKQIVVSILAATKQSLIAPNKKIKMDVQGIDILLPSSQATSLALILNELVQNALEHGFGDGYDEGTICVALHEDAKDVTLTVSNDGEPVPDGFDFHLTDSLGLQIVESLARGDLHGSFVLEKDKTEDLTVAKLVFQK